MTASVAADLPVAGMRAYVDFWYGAGAWDGTGSGLRQSLMRDTERVASDLAKSLAKSWQASRLARVECPTLVMMALESHVVGLRVTEMVAEAIPGARLVMVPDAGHMAPLTDPRVTTPLIAAHLRFVDRFRNAPLIAPGALTCACLVSDRRKRRGSRPSHMMPGRRAAR